MVFAKEDKVQNAVGGRYSWPDTMLIADSVPVPVMTLVDLLRQIPFVSLDNDNYPTIRNQSAIIFVDGFKMDDSFARDYVSSTSAVDVYFIDVDRSGITAGRSSPIIYIYTKTGNGAPVNNEALVSPGILNIIHPGYQSAIAFFTPDYSTPSEKPDYRLQLYWQPDIKIDSGKAHVEFYVGDDRGSTYDIIIEGMTKSGKAVVGKSQAMVK